MKTTMFSTSGVCSSTGHAFGTDNRVCLFVCAWYGKVSCGSRAIGRVERAMIRRSSHSHLPVSLHATPRQLIRSFRRDVSFWFVSFRLVSSGGCFDRRLAY